MQIQIKTVSTSEGLKNHIRIQGVDFHVQPELFLIRNSSEIVESIKMFLKTGTYKNTAVEGFVSNIKKV